MNGRGGASKSDAPPLLLQLLFPSGLINFTLVEKVRLEKPGAMRAPQPEFEAAV